MFRGYYQCTAVYIAGFLGMFVVLPRGVSAAAQFTQNPPSTLYVPRGQTVRFVWDYQLDEGTRLNTGTSPAWYFYDSTLTAHRIGYHLTTYWGKAWKLDTANCPTRLQRPTVRVSQESKATLVITSVTKGDNGVYECRLILYYGLPVISKVQLIVTGSPCLKCNKELRLTSPIYKQLSLPSNDVCRENNTCTCVDALVSLSAPMYGVLNQPVFPKNIGHVYTYIYKSCRVDNTYCQRICEDIRKLNPSTTLSCSFKCCSGADYCNEDTHTTISCSDGYWSDGKPCLNYGTCKTVYKSKYCVCHDGFYGDRCQYKVKGFTICSNSTNTVTTINGKNSTKTSSDIIKCPDYQKCFNSTFKMEYIHSGNNFIQSERSIRSCVNATYCSDLGAYVKTHITSKITKLFNVSGECCDGDFCNILVNDLLNNRVTRPPSYPGHGRGGFGSTGKAAIGGGFGGVGFFTILLLFSKNGRKFIFKLIGCA